MRIGMSLNYAGGFAETVVELADYEKAGLEIVFVPEAYSFDAVSQLGFIAAKTERLQIASGIFQLYSRTPALTAMTAAGLDYVSAGRFTLGIGASGPQVIEGWHGVPYDAPVGRTREAIEICRMVWRRERLEYAGQHYTLPPLDVVAQAGLAIGGDVTGYLDLARPILALYIGGMGPHRDKGSNFYYELAVRYGFGEQAAKIQDAYLDGRKDEAAALVPAELLAGTSLVGPEGYVAERIAALKESGVTTLNVTPIAPAHADRVRLIEKVRDLAT